jgi:hypothetical protein
VTVSAAPNLGGCYLTWAAKATDPTVLVSYQVPIGANSFRDTVTVLWDQRGPTPDTVAWVLSAGTWGVQGRKICSCAQAGVC